MGGRELAEVPQRITGLEVFEGRYTQAKEATQEIDDKFRALLESALCREVLSRTLLANHRSFQNAGDD